MKFIELLSRKFIFRFVFSVDFRVLAASRVERTALFCLFLKQMQVESLIGGQRSPPGGEASSRCFAPLRLQQVRGTQISAIACIDGIYDISLPKLICDFRDTMKKIGRILTMSCRILGGIECASLGINFFGGNLVSNMRMCDVTGKRSFVASAVWSERSGRGK